MVVGRCAVVLAVVSLSAPAFATPPTITAAEAKDHLGKRVTVCGEVVAVGHAIAAGRGGKQTFLHFDQAPPQTQFTGIIIGSDLAGGGAFFGIEKKVEHKRVCVTGYIKRRSADATMMLLDAPNQLTVADADSQ